MEIESRLGKNSYWREAAIALSLATLILLGCLGGAVTRVAQDGNGQILTWSDYQLGKAERAYQNERAILRTDADTPIGFLAENSLSNPVAVKVVVNRIRDHTSTAFQMRHSPSAIGRLALLARIRPSRPYRMLFRCYRSNHAYQPTESDIRRPYHSRA